MADNLGNQRRAFADVVTIEAWHRPFTDQVAMVDLHADVVFSTARVGGETGSLVTFRLSLKRAELVVVVPVNEPASVDITSVAREGPDQDAVLTKTIETSMEANTKAGFSASVSTARVTGGATLGAEGKARYSASDKLKISEKIGLILVSQSKTADGHYRWSMEPRASGILEGRPWNAAKEPRLKLRTVGKGRSKLPPTVRVELSCRQEDLVIDDIEIKDRGLWATVRNSLGFHAKRAAAVSYIRARLIEDGLEVKNIEDRFGQLTLYSVFATPN
jgi:hypothetical protein